MNQCTNAYIANHKTILYIYIYIYIYVGDQRETVVDDDIRIEQLNNEITAEEVAAAMGKIKRKAAPGKMA